jgi:outer membrane biosynthesis protein TonB
MSEVEKRGRGRPKGSLNLKTIAKTIAKQKQMHDATTDVTFNEVSFEPWEHEEKQEPEETEETEKAEEEAQVAEEAVEEEAVEEEAIAEEAVEEEKPKPKRRKKVVKEDTPPPTPVRVNKRKPRATAIPRAPDPPLTYLQGLQKGLSAAKATQTAEKIQRYDAYFSHL